MVAGERARLLPQGRRRAGGINKRQVVRRRHPEINDRRAERREDQTTTGMKRER